MERNKIDGLPEGWKLFMIEEIASIKGGKRLPLGKTFSSGKTLHPYIRVSDFNENGGINQDGIRYVNEEIFSQISNYIINSDDLYISIAGTIGKSGIIPKSLDGSCLTENAARLVFNKGIDVSNKYIYFASKTANFLQQTELASKTAAQPKLALTRLGKINVNLPSLSEQERIVAKLDGIFEHIDASIKLLEQNIADADAMAESVLSEIFNHATLPKDWQQSTLGDIFEITSSKRVFESDWKKDGVPFYRAREIVKLSLNGNVDNELFITEEMYMQYAKKYGIPKAGDIMITGVGTLGICYIVKENDRFYFKDGNIIWLKTGKREINSQYVGYAFKSRFITNQVNQTSGSVVGTYTIIRAKGTKIPLPPLPEQERIVAKLDAFFAEQKAIKSGYETKISELKALKSSILSSAFRGEI